MKYLLTLGLLGLARGEYCGDKLLWLTSGDVGKCYPLNRIKYYCANGSEEYAEMLGGIICPEGPGVTPECPNNKPCLCIDPDGDCNDNDDWGYVNQPPESSASQLSLFMPLATVAIACLSRV